MLFRLVRPVKRQGSRNRYFVKRIPSDVMALAVGLKLAIPIGDHTQHATISPRANMVRLSLRTDDPGEVKVRQAQVDAYLDSVWHALRANQPIPLSHRQATALAGELYRAWAGGDRERTFAMVHTPGVGWDRDYETHEDPGEWQAVNDYWERVGATGEPTDLETRLGALVDRLLLAKGIKEVDQATRGVVLRAFWQALRDAFGNRKRQAEGDYSPDPKAERFPEWQAPSAAASIQPQAFLKGLVEAWWVEAKATGRKPSTYESYRNTMAAFIAYLGHDDAKRIGKEDVIGFKNYRLARVNSRNGRPISAKTVKDSDLAGLKTIFGWAVSNGRMASNPAEGVTLKLGKPRKVRSKGFSDSEANAILTAAMSLKQGAERLETFAAKRWVPWLCAYTGARVGELAQLRKEDVRCEGVHWIITITPDAGTVKTNEARDVVLHPHLVDLGFIAFVETAPSGHLFVKPAHDGGVLGPLKGLTNRIAEFVRTVIDDRNVAPNHGWRHRFKTVGMEVEVAPRILDAIQGQRPRTVAESYGDITIKTLAAAIAKFPRYKINAV